MVDEFYDEFEDLLNLLQLYEEYVFSIFLSNLKEDISRCVYSTSLLLVALKLARQVEYILYDTSKRSFASLSQVGLVR